MPLNNLKGRASFHISFVAHARPNMHRNWVDMLSCTSWWAIQMIKLRGNLDLTWPAFKIMQWNCIVDLCTDFEMEQRSAQSACEPSSFSILRSLMGDEGRKVRRFSMLLCFWSLLVAIVVLKSRQRKVYVSHSQYSLGSYPFRTTPAKKWKPLFGVLVVLFSFV